MGGWILAILQIQDILKKVYFETKNEANSRCIEKGIFLGTNMKQIQDVLKKAYFWEQT